MYFFFRKKFFQALILFSLFPFSVQSQNLAGYIDYRGNLNVFDDGSFRQLDYLPVKSFQPGGNALAFVDNTTQFKIYYGGLTYDIMYGANVLYEAGKNFIVYRSGSVLSVFDKGDKINLTYYISKFVVGDSLIGFVDDSHPSLKVYYKGEVLEVENSLLEQPRQMQAGINTLAYVNQSDHFKVFYHDEVKELESVAPDIFKPGGDIVAYVDGYDHYFKAFYKGDKARLEITAPDTFKVGNGILAYTDNTGNFKILYNGNLKKIISFAPDYFLVNGNMVVYSFNTEFNVFYMGKIYPLENYTPADFQLDYDGLAYIDQSNHLVLFLNGEKKIISYEAVSAYKLSGNVLTYQLNNRTSKLYFKGTTF